ncbi:MULTISPECIES: L,D-transpeptidase [unclassified Ensifer]|uniref:L,D-transpeptidase n=1 Tax=unclassified Ensifer TaxID=2633371 RepID=UPI0008139A38|nr:MULTISPECIES: L,D-transpeptidase [unclassified Ensifer]OCP18305.1 hypothetical protein BC361_06455 [Ensifer sp. LC54]OCP27522.1 hypothetical protein BC363_13575 [Ensifer sp. LC384]OCP35252.1 hypothetical protein BC360_08110 [Ensifer sp. LC163]
MSFQLSRRSLLAVVASSILSACTQVPKPGLEANAADKANKGTISPPEKAPIELDRKDEPAPKLDYAQIYGPVKDEGYDVPAVQFDAIKPEFLRQEVDYATNEPAYSIVVDTQKMFLYWVLPGGKAIRYGVGLGAQGRAWKGRAVVHWKRKWPRWTVPDDMVARQPHLKKYGIEAGGMDPGLGNPLGARAMYIFQDGKDTLYRIHGSPQWRSIGKNASAGCVRMLQQDAIDLYNRVRGKTPLLVI